MWELKANRCQVCMALVRRLLFAKKTTSQISTNLKHKMLCCGPTITSVASKLATACQKMRISLNADTCFFFFGSIEDLSHLPWEEVTKNYHQNQSTFLIVLLQGGVSDIVNLKTMSLIVRNRDRSVLQSQVEGPPTSYNSAQMVRVLLIAY